MISESRFILASGPPLGCKMRRFGLLVVKLREVQMRGLPARAASCRISALFAMFELLPNNLDIGLRFGNPEHFLFRGSYCVVIIRLSTLLLSCEFSYIMESKVTEHHRRFRTVRTEARILH